MKKIGIITVIFLSILLLAGLMAGCDKKKKKETVKTTPKTLPKPPPGVPADVDRVIFVLLDAARGDHFGAYGYKRNTTPKMDEIAKKGTVFLNHYSQSHATRVSMPQLMTGKYFAQGIIASLEDTPSIRLNYTFVQRDPTEILLTELVKKQGFKTVAFSAHTGITGKTVLGKSFMKFYGEDDDDAPYPLAGNIVPEVQRWVIKNRDKKFFLYLHLMDTHFPHELKPEHNEFIDPNYDWQKDFRESGKPHYSYDNPWDERYHIADKTRNKAFVRHLNDIYDGDLKYADKWVGKLYDTIVELGIETKTMFIITADHGEELGEHGWYTHVGQGPWAPSYHLPLIIVWPGHVPESQRIKTFTQHVDILPTLVDLLGLTVPEGKTYDGKSLVDLFKNPYSKIRDFICGASHDYRFIRTEKWSFGRFQDNKLQLYDLEKDPGEHENIAASKPEVVEKLLDELEREIGSSYKSWKALPYTKAKIRYLVPLKRMLDYKDIMDLGRGKGLDVPPGNWVRKGAYFIGHGITGDVPQLTFEAEIPNALYKVDLECVHSFSYLPGDASLFSASINDGKMREFSSADRIKWGRRVWPKKKYRKRGWKRIFVPIGLAEVTDGKITVKVQPLDDPSKWLIIKSVRLKPKGAKKSELSDVERKKLKALGYIE